MNKLVDAVTELLALRGQADAAQRATITAAVQRAHERYEGLESGLAAWSERATTNKALWHAGGTSKLIPTWPRWQTGTPKPWPTGAG